MDYQDLLALLTAERLGSYLSAAEGDVDAAFALYEWNVEVAAAALSLTAMVEVVLRNALDKERLHLGGSKRRDRLADRRALGCSRTQ